MLEVQSAQIPVYRAVFHHGGVGAKPCLRPVQEPKVRTFCRQKQPFPRRKQRAETRLRPYMVCALFAIGFKFDGANTSINCDLPFKFPFIGLLFAQLTPSVRRGDLWSPGVGTENLNILPFKITVLSSKQAGDHRSPLR